MNKLYVAFSYDNGTGSSIVSYSNGMPRTTKEILDVGKLVKDEMVKNGNKEGNYDTIIILGIIPLTDEEDSV